MKKLLVISVFIIFYFVPTKAQYKIINYTDMNQINSLVEDGDYIWVCTSGGAFKRRKSDGTLVTVFNTLNSGLARNRVNAMYIDFYGNYWFGTNYGGISMFDGSKWTTINEVDGFRIYDCETITADINGNMWFGVNDGHVLKYDGETWKDINLHGNWYVASIVSDDIGNIWIGIAGIHGSGYKIDPEGNVSDFNGPGDIFKTNGIYDIGKDRLGNLWFTSYGGVYRYNILSDTWTNFSSGFYGNNYAFSLDGNGNVWISTDGGVYEYNGSIWTHYTSGESGDRVDLIPDILCDAQNNVWVGGYNGLAKITPGNYTWGTAIRVNALKSDYVETMSFTRDGTARLFGQFSYMTGYSDGYWWETSPVSSCSYSWVENSLTDKDDNTWISYIDGADSTVKLIKFTPANVATCYSVSGKMDFGQWTTAFVTDMTYDPKYNLIWIGTKKGLIWFNASYGSSGTWTSPTYGLPEDYITGVDIHDGVVWYSTSASGIGYYDVNNGDFGVLDESSGLPSNQVYDLAFDKNGGMYFLAGPTLYHKINDAYKNYSLPDYYNCLAVDSMNNIWLGGNFGAAKFNGRAIRTFTTDDGLTENMVDNIVVAPNNDVWLCSGYYGITKINTVAPQPGFDTPITCLPDTTFLSNMSTEADTLTRYAWDINDDGSIESTAKNFRYHFDVAGIYTIGLTAWNDEKNGHITKDIQVLESPDATISPSGINHICTGDKIRIQAGINNPDASLKYTYNWNTGDQSNRIYTDTSGVYYFSVSNGMCNSMSDSATVIAAEPFSGLQICLVTVDPDENKNMIVWQPANDLGVVSYNIYKLFGNSYVPIGNVPAGDPSYFVDYNSTPDALAARYAITAIDTCGNESAKSPYHQTIHLGASIGAQANTIVLDWTPYVDESGNFQPEWYYIYRGLSADQMQVHDSVSSSFTEWNDLDPGENRYYQIGAKKADPCYVSTKKTTGGPYAHSLSNLEDNKLKAGTGTLTTGRLTVYPNPFHDQAVIVWDNAGAGNVRIIITDLRGRVVRETDNVPGNRYTLRKENLNPGMYFITIEGQKIFQTKIVVN